MKHFGILFVIFLCVSCGKTITITCKDLPKAEQTAGRVNFNNSLEKVTCQADTPFTNEDLNKRYSSFFQTPFLLYEIKNLKSSTRMKKVSSPGDSNVAESEYFLSKKKNPLYYIRAFSRFSMIKNWNQGMMVHTLYYETERSPFNRYTYRRNEVDDSLDAESVLWPNNLLSACYEFTNNNVLFTGDKNKQFIIDNFRLEIDWKYFTLNSAEFDSQNNMKYMEISHSKGNKPFPPEITTIKIEPCMLKLPNVSLDKCGLIKKMLKDMVIYYYCDITSEEDFCKGWPNIFRSF